MSEEETTPETESDSEILGDAGKAALVAERKRADEAEKANKELERRLKTIEEQGLTELETARAEIESMKAASAELATANSELQLNNVKLNIGLAEGLPMNLIARMQGADEDALKADAVALKEFIPDNKHDPFPKADPSQGPGRPTKQSNATQFAAQLDAAGF